MVIWLLAVAWQAGNGGLRLPRRLIYVVNRRTVVDQATDVAEELRKRLRGEDCDGLTPAESDGRVDGAGCAAHSR